MRTKELASIYGTILGDLCGQPYEYKFKGNIPTKDEVDIYNNKSKFTDDTILTLASYRSMYDERYRDKSVAKVYKDMTLDYQDRGFGKKFLEWARMDDLLYTGESWGNGAIMRIAPFIVNNDLKGVCDSIMTSHCSPIALRAGIELYELYHSPKRKFDNIRRPFPFEEFTSKADDTLEKVKEIFYCTDNTHDAIKMAVSLGGDTDTVASIVGGLSAYHYDDITLKDVEYVKSKLQYATDLAIILRRL